jgi:hypothetical protein
LHVLSTYPADGAGVGAMLGAAGATSDICGAGDTSGDCVVARDTRIELRFDRFLFPLGLSAGLRLYSGNPADPVPLDVSYDPIERVVAFRPVAPIVLEPDALYTAEVLPTPQLGSGFWAFDGAPLEAGSAPLRFSFVTGAEPTTQSPLPVRSNPPDTCTTLTQGSAPTAKVFDRCASSGCHTNTGQDAAMGLALNDPWGVKYTAIKRVAHEADTGEVAGAPLPVNLRFGTGMPVIDPGSPATSYLVYKLLRKPQNFGPAPDFGCTATEYPELPLPGGACTYASVEELTALREWFSRGKPMPRDDNSTGRALQRQELDRVVDWIALKAPCDVVF